MRLTNQSAILIPQGPGLEGIFKQIEIAARTCYKSEDKITEGSAKKMVDGLIKRNHTAMLEHGTVYLKKSMPKKTQSEDLIIDREFLKEYSEWYDFQERYCQNPYSVVKNTADATYVTTNYRVIVENKWEDDLQYIISRQLEHEPRYTIKAITNLQVSQELVRHRTMSFAMESSRYCNYSQDKFSNELTFIKPLWFDKSTFNAQNIWTRHMERVEYDYFALLQEGWKPQQAAQVLDKATKTEVVLTGSQSQWEYWLDLRYFEKTGPVHPQMKELASLVADELRNYFPIKNCVNSESDETSHDVPNKYSQDDLKAV